MTLPPEPPRGMPTRLLLTLLTALALVAAIAVASVRMHPSARRRVVVVLPTAPGLREGGPVTYLGVAAGQVERIDLSTGRVVVTLGIARPDVVLRAGDVVRLRTAGLLGDRVVDITPGPASARALAAGDTLVVRSLPAEPPAADSAAVRELMRAFERRDSATRVAH